MSDSLFGTTCMRVPSRLFAVGRKVEKYGSGPTNVPLVFSSVMILFLTHLFKFVVLLNEFVLEHLFVTLSHCFFILFRHVGLLDRIG